MDPPDIIIDSGAEHMRNISLLRKKYITDKNIATTTATYYTVVYYLYVVTIILLTGLVSILSFVTAFDVISASVNRWLNLSSGIISIMIGILHNLMNAYKIQTKKTLFDQSRNRYNKFLQSPLIDDPIYTERKTFGIRKGNKYQPPEFIVRRHVVA